MSTIDLVLTMNEKSHLYWTSFSTYERCPQLFLWKYGWDGVDAGWGDGQRRPRPPQDDQHHAVLGIVIQKAIEKMYNDELYRDPENLSKNLMELVDRHWIRTVARGKHVIDENVAGMSQVQMVEICKEGVRGYLQTMKEHRLLGKYAKAEVKLVGWVNKWLGVAGRPDVIIRRDDTGITIIDGKNTSHKMKYTDPDQLRFYALVFRLAYKQMPDRLGFVWYRYPAGAETYDPDSGETIRETGVEWVEFDEDDLKGLAVRANEARNGMRKKKFAPKPSPDNCRFCDFESVCEARQAQIKRNGGGKPRASAKVEEMEGSDGFSDFSL